MNHLQYIIFFLLILSFGRVDGQKYKDRIDSFRIHNDIKVTIDLPANTKLKKETIITFYALPNGNTTVHSMGKKMEVGDDVRLF